MNAELNEQCSTFMKQVHGSVGSISSTCMCFTFSTQNDY